MVGLRERFFYIDTILLYYPLLMMMMMEVSDVEIVKEEIITYL